MKSMSSTVERTNEEEILKILVEQAPVGVCIMQNGKFCYVNSNFPVAIGYTVDELIGKDSLEIVVPEDREMVKENTIKMLKGELTSPYQFRVTCKDGSIVWVMATVKPIQYHGRQAVLGNYMEITGRKQIEDALKESEERYRELANSITDVFFAMDEHLRYTYWNKASEALTGIRAEDAIGKSLREIFPDKPWRRRAEKVYRSVLKTQQPRTFVNDYNINGRHYIFEISAYPSRGGIAVIVSDITDRKQAEDRLKESEQKYRLLFETSPDCIAQIDREGRYLTANPATARSLGVSLEELNGKAVSKVVPRKVAQHRLRMMRKALDEWQPQTFEDERAGRYFHHIVIPIKTLDQKEAVQVITRDVTEHRKMEETLRESENKLRLISENSRDIICLHDPDHKYVYISPACKEVLGYEPDELVGTNPWELVHPEDIEALQKEGQEKALQGMPALLSYRIRKKSGGYIWFESVSQLLKDGAGNVSGFVTSSRDITERKNMEEAINLQRAYFQQLFDNSPDAILMTNTNSKVIQANRGSEVLFGYSNEEVKGRSLTELIVPEVDVQEASDSFQRILGGEVIRKEAVRRRKDGSLVDVSILAYPIRSNDKLIGLYGVYSDISERKQAEEALRQSEERYRTILEEMEDAYFEVDLGGHLTFVNDSVCRDLGYSREELVGMSYKGFTVEEDIESVFRVFNEVYQTGVPNKGFPWKTIRKDGVRGFAETSISLLRNDKGEIIGFRGVGRDITERKQAEEALQAERNKLQSIIDAMQDDLTIQDRDYNIIFQNEPARISSGGDHVGEKCYRVYEGNETICKDCPVAKSFKDSKPHVSERQRVLPSGELSFWETTSNPIRDAKGRVAACLEIGRDITERKKQEQALADELTRRRLLIDQSLDGIVVLDVDAKVVEANQRFAEMLGYTIEEVHELHTWNWDKQFPRKKILEMGRGVDEKGFRLETKHTCKNGSVIDVDISIHGAICAGQKLIFCVCRDITERNKMDKALKQAAEEWKRTFDSITDAISIHDREFRILRANKAFADIFHMKPSQVIGGLCYELHKGQKPHSGCPHKQTLATKEPAAEEFYESNLGKYLHESTSPIFDEKGEVVATVHITRDVTEQKQQNERLMMTDRLASLGELASGAAHELNNPLTSIIGFSQLLMEKETPDDIREDLKLIYSEAQRAVSVTNNLLSFARKHAPVKQFNQINNIIEDVLELRAHEHKINHIDVERHLDPNLPEIMVDYFQMQQVLMNIIINAEYFMIQTHNAGTLTITTKKENSTVRISIADDGPGITPENLGRIFDPFFTTKEAGKGTGLGLSICHGIVTEHSGQIYIRSQLGKGATIFVELPIKNRAQIKSKL